METNVNANPFYGVRSKALADFINVGVDDIMVVEGPIRIFSIFYNKVSDFLDLSDYNESSPTVKFFENKPIHKILLGLVDGIMPERVLINESKGIVAIKFETTDESIDNFFSVKRKCTGPSFIIQPVGEYTEYYYVTFEDGAVVVKTEK